MPVAGRQRAAYKVEVAWDSSIAGVLQLDRSTLGGPDVLAANSFSQAFGGPYSDLTNSVGLRVEDFSTTRGRSDDLAQMLQSTCSLNILDTTGILNPKNAASPIHAFLRPQRPLRITDVYGAVTRPRFYGFIRTIEYEPGQRHGYAKIEAGDLFTWLEAPRDDHVGGGVILPVIAATGRTTVGAAIGLILDAIGWTDQAMRKLDRGSDIPDFSADGRTTPLALIGALLEADRGLFYIDRAGRAVFEDRNLRQTRASYATIANSMTAIAPGTTLDRVVNRWTVTRQLGSGQGPAQVAEDLPSADEFGNRESSLTTSYLMTDDSALQLAGYLLSRTKDPDATIWRLQLDNRDQTQFLAILDSELGKRITLSEAKTNTSGDYFIEQVQETVSSTDKSHVATMLLTERKPVELLKLDTSLLGGPEVLGY